MKTGNRPEGLVVDSRSLFVAVRASGAGHYGGTLTVLTAPGYLDNVDPALAYSLPDGQVAVLTHDGLVGFRRVGGNAGLELVPDLAVSLPTPTDGGLTYSFQLRPGIRYSTGALVRPQDFRRAIERTLELSRQGAYNAPYYAGIVGARRCLADPKRPCDLSQGIETHAGSSTITFHLISPDADFLNKLASPRRVCRARRNAASPAWLRCLPPAPTRSRHSIPNAESGSFATPGFASGRRRPSQMAFLTLSSSASAARRTRTSLAVLDGSADLAGGATNAAIRGRRSPPCERSTQATS